MKSANKLLKITGWTTFIVLFIFVLAYFLNSFIKEKYFEFCNIDSDSVDCVVLYKFSIDSCSDSIVLSKNQTERFIRKWNNSYAVGPCKYIPRFTLNVRLKNGIIRKFLINGKTIKETDDFGYRFLCDENFFKSIWNKQ
jgi:hypothetical protein